MKFFKKILLLLATAVIFLSAGVIVACSDDTDSSSSSSSSSESAEPVDYVYKIRVQSIGGFGLRNVIVSLLDGETKVASVLTNASGNAIFTDDEVTSTGAYTVELSDIPAGWHVDDDVVYQTSLSGNTQLTISLTPELITDEETPIGKQYQLGDVMYDFTLQTTDNKTYKLSSVLAEKKMVLLNFWAIRCGPCKTEFPIMNNAYIQYQNDVSILAITKEDDAQSTRNYKQDMGLTFDFASQPSLGSNFSIAAIPVSIVIDRYGVISYWEVGSMTSLGDFTGLFDKFVGDDYVQTVIGAGEYEGSGNDGTEETELMKPNVTVPLPETVTPVLTSATDTFTTSWEDNEYSWPWLVTESETDGKYLRASNGDIHNSFSILHVDFTAQANTTLFFDAYISTETGSDYLLVSMDGVPIHQLSGNSDSETQPVHIAGTDFKWQTYCAYVFGTDEDGEHTLSLSYVKDASLSGGEDEVWIRNLRFGTVESLDNTNTDVNIFRYAATGYNDPETTSGKNAVTQYENYVELITPEESGDGYYHVKSETAKAGEIGPYLFIDPQAASLWNTYDLWQLAYNGKLVYKGHNLKANLEDYAWIGVNSSNGYVPVSEDLKDLLVYISKIEGIVGEKSDKAWHENEWLELCVYFDHYGKSEPMSDPTRGISFESAIPVQEGKNHIVCDVSLVPLGIKHKFTTPRSGVYRIRSLVPAELEDTAASADPQCWIVADDKTTFLDYNDDYILAAGEKNGNVDNFDICIYMEEGKTYYMLFAFFLNATGEFDMNIEYLGEEYDYLTNCAIGPYSYNEVTSEMYMPGTVDYALDENGVYRVVVTDNNGNESLGSKIYLDLVNATYLFPGNSLAEFIESADDYETSKRLFYLDGVDYSEYMKELLFYAKQNHGAMYGLTELTDELMDILLKLTKVYDGFGGVKNSWQMACYYYKHVQA